MARSTNTPTLDLVTPIASMVRAQLDDQRDAVLERLNDPQTGDDLDALVARAGELAQALEADDRRAAAAADARRSLLALHRGAAPQERPGGGGERTDERAGERAEVTTLGRAFIESDAFRDYQERDGVGSTRRVVIEQRALFSTSNYPSQATRVPGIVAAPDAPLTILDLIDRQSMGTNSIEYVQEDTDTTGAAEVAEGTAKPESTWTASLKTATAATIAHYLNITRQTVQDEQQVQGYIEGRLSLGLYRRVNGQVLNGNGTAPNLRGILNTTGIGTYAPAAAESYLVSIRKARTVAELSEYQPDGVVLHPSDWEAVELDTNDSGTFRAVAAVTDGAARRVWGLAVVSTPTIAAGTGLVGAFREGATLWERTGVEVYITDSHASNFTSNILTLLAELRAALTVWRPKAFVKITFNDGV